MAQLVEIMLSTNRFESEVLAEAVLAEGHRAELVHDESSGGVGTQAIPSRLLVHASDAEEVRAIVNRSFALDAEAPDELRPSRISNKARLIGLLLLIVMVGVIVL